MPSPAHLLTQTATIHAEAAVGDVPPQTPMGGVDRTVRLLVADAVPCLVRPRSATLAAMLGRRDDARADVFDARIYFASDPAPGGLSSRHWITVDGKTYKVTAVIDANSMGRLFQVDCEMTNP